MKLLIEQLDYEINTISRLLPAKYFTYKNDQKVSIDYVGYYNNFETNETVIILPKIFLDEATKTIFGSIPVNDFVNENALEILKNHQKSKTDIDFIYRFALVFYLSLREFQQRNADTDITESTSTKNIISNIETTVLSELDLIFSLLRFYQENKDLIIFKQKESERQHFKKTDWVKTIRKQTPIFQDNIPIYTKNNQSQPTQNNDNELLIIFFSVLKHFELQYGFNISLENITIQKISQDFERKSLRTLKSIKQQYFSDKFKKLLFLLIAYFEKKSVGSGKESNKEEFILCKNYNIVFEDMIDKLLSDKGKTIDKMKYQQDGKILDHIFEHHSFFEPDSIFYIGDSKYYKESTQYSKNSIYKQHTYAKNVIQYNINLFNEAKPLNNIRYRDELTEGYNITPNFFIQGFIDHQNLANSMADFQFDTTQKPKINYHFENRIFDRDTLFVYNFRINFVFVLQSYLEKNQEYLADFSDKSKKTIREQIWEHLYQEYDFFYLKPTTNLKDFVAANFKILNGKIYINSQTKDSLILGLKKNFQESTEIKNMFGMFLTKLQ